MKKKSKQSKAKKSKQTSQLAYKVIGAFLVLAILGYATYSMLPRATPIGINEIAPSSNGTVSLSFPPSITSAINAESSADISIDAGTTPVSAIQVEITYDPESISTPSLVQGDFLSEKLGEPQIGNGKISFVYVTPLGSNGQSGSGKLATLKFKLLKPSTQLSFGSNTMIAAVGNNNNVLRAAAGTTISTPSAPTPAEPPILIEIKPAPGQSSQAQPATQNTPSKPKSNESRQSETKPNETKAGERVFDPTGNFDYSKTNNVDTSDSTISSEEEDLSGFAKFLATIKKFFGAD